jgi:XRE family aerobic/anaerobic benzoate catabolism transcriptional regulator
MSANPRAMDDLVSILNSREPLYAKADATLDTNGRSIDASLTDLAALTASQTGL